MYGDAHQEIPEAPLGGEGLDEGLCRQEVQQARRQSAAQVDAAGRQHPQGQIASLGCQDVPEELQGRAADCGLPLDARTDNHPGRIRRAGQLGGQPVRLFVTVAVAQKTVQGRQPAARTHLLVTDVTGAGSQIRQEFGAQRCVGRKVGMAAFRGEGAVGVASPQQERLPQAGAGGDNAQRRLGRRPALVERFQILSAQVGHSVGDGSQVVEPARRRAQPCAEGLLLDHPRQVRSLDAAGDDRPGDPEAGAADRYVLALQERGDDGL